MAIRKFHCILHQIQSPPLLTFKEFFNGFCP
jgi:hypothetical protein